MAHFPSYWSVFGADGESLGGGAPGDHAGWSVAAAGDVNGDGIDDILVGAPSDGSGPGKAYLIFGRAGGLGAVDLGALTPDSGVVITGAAPGDVAGWSVSAAGDLNRDGKADIVIGARLADAGSVEDAGKAYVIFGQTAFAGPIDLAALDPAAGFTIAAAAAFDRAGWSVAAAGDVDGDGDDDLLVGVPGTDGSGNDRGAVYVVFGHGGSFADLDLAALGGDGFAILGGADYDEAGRSVAGAGDVNGDGFDDILVGAGHANGYSGAAYVLFGHAGGFGTVDLGLLGSGGFGIVGGAAEQAGFSVASAGDVNGDGFDDIIVGAPYAEAGAGRAYVIFGHDGPFATIELDSLAEEQGFVIAGAAAGDKAGFSTSSAGDINGDGFDDLVVGAPYADDDGGLDRGAAYVIFGHGGTFGPIDLAAIASDRGFAIHGAADYDQAGRSVFFSGDLNGDGIDDLLVGAPYSGAGDAGGAYIVYGKRDVPSLSVDLDGDADGVDYSGGYAEAGASAPIGDAIAVTQDAPPITGATITVTDFVVGDALNLAGALPATITGLSGAGTGTLILAGNGASADDWAAALALVRYASTSDNPDAFGADGARTITVVVSDGLNSSPPATATIAITAVNDPPVAIADTDDAIEDGPAITGSVATNDGDADDDSATLSYALVTPVAGLTFNPDGSYSFDPSHSAYRHLAAGATAAVVASYTVTDSDNAGDTGTLTITVTGVNDAPAAVDDVDDAIEDGPAVTGSVATNDSDADETAVLTYALNAPVAGLTLNPDGSYSFDPSNAAYQHLKGGETLNVAATYTVTDAQNATDSATLTIVVTGANDEPAGDDDTIVLFEDLPYALTAADFGFSDAIDSDGFAGVVITNLLGAGTLLLDGHAVAAGQFVSVEDIEDGLLVFVNSLNENGDCYASFDFQVRDDGGTDHDGVDTDQSANRIIFDVAAVNDAPFGSDNRVSIVEDTDQILTAADFAYGDAEGDDLLSVTIVMLPGNGILLLDGAAVTNIVVSRAQLDGNLLVFRPDPDENGTDHAQLTFRVRDDGGTGNSGADADPVANFLHFDVDPVNDAPTATGLASDDAGYIENGLPVALDVGGNAAIADIDSLDFAGGTLTVAITGNVAAAEDLLDIGGSARVCATGSHIQVDGVDIASYAGGTAGQSLVFSFNAQATPDRVQALLRVITYVNLNTVDPSTLQRTISWTLVDGDGDADTLSFTSLVTLLSANDAPTLGAAGTDPIFTEGEAGAELFRSASASTIESGQSIDRLVLTVSGLGDGAGERLVIDGIGIALTNGFAVIAAHGLGVDVAVSAGVATVTIAGAQSASVYAALIDALAYVNASENPTAGDRVVTLVSIRDTGGTDNGAGDTASLSIASTVTVVPVDDAASIHDDAVATLETNAVSGSLFADNGAGADSDVDSALVVTAVNGSDSDVGARIVLASGALLTVNADGSYSYDPNHAFDSTPAAGSGAANIPAGDSFTYAANGFTATVTVTVNGIDSNDTLLGTAGDDYLFGGIGNDTYYVDSAGDVAAEAAGQGNDRVAATVTYALTAASEIETLEAINSGAVEAMDLTGNAFANTITGNAGVNILRGDGGSDILGGLAGNDHLVGGTGADFMYGGTGDDTYYVDNESDQTSEQASEGTDRIATSISYALLAGSEIELLEVNDTFDLDAIDLTGSDGANRIIGNAGANLLRGAAGGDALIALGGNDYLDGGTGADLMYGGTGDDVYYVDNEGDQAFETAGEGTDRIATSISYALNTASEIELLESVNTADTGAMDLTGSDSLNAIIGNAGVNILRGEGGNDTLVGLAGDDYLVGGTGTDLMYGGTGDDTYYADAAGDTVAETAGQGNDRIATSVGYTLAAGSEVERLEAVNQAETGALDLAGNEFANTIVGNDGANLIDGKDGNDVLAGLGGADAFAFTTAPGAGNVDVIADFLPGSDRIALDDAVFGALTPGAFHAGTAATDADQRIIYDQASGNLYYDADGSGAAAQLLFATLDGRPALTASDFLAI